MAIHDVWINLNPENFIIGDDGGGEWPLMVGNLHRIRHITAQFYHVSVDNEFPYNIYGAQQDNSSIHILLDLVAMT
jgi:hypothetical protein